MKTLGQMALFLALEEEEKVPELMAEVEGRGYRALRGKVGSMNMEKVVAAVETAAKRQGLVTGGYREEHALYHAVLEALNGVCRGQLALGDVLRTVGLTFSVVRGPRFPDEKSDGAWLAVVLYGTIGAPIKGFEHEVIGLGLNHL